MEISAINAIRTYTTSEVAVGTWEGQTLYRKVFTHSATGSSSFSVNGVTVINVRRMSAIIKTQGTYMTQPYYTNAGDWWNYYLQSNGNCYLRGAGGFEQAEYTFWLTLEYIH